MLWSKNLMSNRLNCNFICHWGFHMTTKYEYLLNNVTQLLYAIISFFYKPSLKTLISPHNKNWAPKHFLLKSMKITYLICSIVKETWYNKKRPLLTNLVFKRFGECNFHFRFFEIFTFHRVKNYDSQYSYYPEILCGRQYKFGLNFIKNT